MTASTPTRLALTGISAVTPLGHDVGASCAAIRARLSGLGEHPWYAVQTADPEWDEREPLKAALIPGLDVDVVDRERFLELGLWVLRDLVQSTAMRRVELERSALLLALPAVDRVTGAWALDLLDADLCDRAGIESFAISDSSCAGHTSVFELVGKASQLLAEDSVDQCVVVGIDSYHSRARLSLLDESRRLRTVRSPDGFLPGEAAVAFTVEREGASKRPPLAKLSFPGAGVEPQTVGSERASSSRGLQLAIEAALGGEDAPASSVDWVLCDLNGESYRFFEWGTLRGRLAERFGSDLQVTHPADSIGEVGAASGGVLIACAAQAFERGYAPATEALLWTSSDDGRRAALRLEAPTL